MHNIFMIVGCTWFSTWRKAIQSPATALKYVNVCYSNYAVFCHTFWSLLLACHLIVLTSTKKPPLKKAAWSGEDQSVLPGVNLLWWLPRWFCFLAWYKDSDCPIQHLCFVGELCKCKYGCACFFFNIHRSTDIIYTHTHSYIDDMHIQIHDDTCLYSVYIYTACVLFVWLYFSPARNKSSAVSTPNSKAYLDLDDPEVREGHQCWWLEVVVDFEHWRYLRNDWDKIPLAWGVPLTCICWNFEQSESAMGAICLNFRTSSLVFKVGAIPAVGLHL